MRNYRIKLIDMMSNSSWLYKLKYMGNSSNSNKNNKAPAMSSSTVCNDQSHNYFTLDSLLPSPDPPRKSTRKKRLAKQCSAPSSSFSSSASRRPLVMHAEPRRRSSACCWGVSSSADSDVVLELAGGDEYDKSDSFNADGKVSLRVEFDELDDCFRSAQLEAELPPILTDPPPKFSELVLELKQQKPSSKFSSQTEEKLPQVLSVKTVKDQDKVSSRKSVSSRGVRIRSSSARIAAPKKVQTRKQSNRVSDGIAVMKSSSDPLKDFRESMMEMIVENNIRGYKELENLLACYLSLNSSEYHDAIVQVFAQIWLDHLPLPY